MRKLTYALAVLAFLGLNSCDNQADSCIEVRIVESVCGNTILQVVSGNIGVDLGTWEDFEGNSHSNVFGTFVPPCDLDAEVLDGSKTFFIELADEQPQFDCVICLALLADMPEQMYDVQVINACNDTGDL